MWSKVNSMKHYKKSDGGKKKEWKVEEHLLFNLDWVQKARDKTMEKQVCCLGEEFKVRYYFDADVRETRIDTNTGESFKIMKGDIKGIEICDSRGNLICNFDYVDFNDDVVIKNILRSIVKEGGQ